MEGLDNDTLKRYKEEDYRLSEKIDRAAEWDLIKLKAEAEEAYELDIALGTPVGRHQEYIRDYMKGNKIWEYANAKKRRKFEKLKIRRQLEFNENFKARKPIKKENTISPLTGYYQASNMTLDRVNWLMDYKRRKIKEGRISKSALLSELADLAKIRKRLIQKK